MVKNGLKHNAFYGSKKCIINFTLKDFIVKRISENAL